MLAANGLNPRNRSRRGAGELKNLAECAGVGWSRHYDDEVRATDGGAGKIAGIFEWVPCFPGVVAFYREVV